MTANIPDTAGIDGLMREVQDTEVFRVEWKELLSSGPRAISKMGACFLAASAENPHFCLVGSPESASGLVYTTLIACVLQVSKKGIETFRLTLPRVSSVYQLSGRIFRILEDIITCIQGFPNARGVTVLQAKLAILSRLTSEFGTDAQLVGTEFLAWVAMMEELRRAVLFKQGHNLLPIPVTPPPPPPAPPPPPVVPPSTVPRIPSLPSPSATDLADMRQPISDIQFWRDVPGMEACTRRTYKCLTGTNNTPGTFKYRTEINNTPDLYLLKSPDGERYTNALSRQLGMYFELVQKLVPHSPPYMAKTRDVLRCCLVHIRDIENDPLDAWGTILPLPQYTSILWGWGLLQELALAAEYHLSLSTPVNTWDRADLMDAQYYPYSTPEIVAPPPQVAIPVQQAPWYLVQCSTALDEAHSEAEKLGQFLSAISASCQDIVTVHVQNFKLSADRLVARCEDVLASDQERADLIRSAQSVKVYFGITRAVTAMYNHIHVWYLDEGLDLLHDLSRASTNAMRTKTHRALNSYCQRVATELETYAERKKTRILEELGSIITEMAEDAGRLG